MMLDILRACGIEGWRLSRLWRLKARVEAGEVSEWDRTHRHLVFHKLLFQAGAYRLDGGPPSHRLRIIAEDKEWKAAA